MNEFGRLMRNAPLFENMLDQSVKFGAIYVPARSLQSVLGAYCKNLLVWTHHDIHKVQLVGTAIPIHYRSRYLLICTAHQLRGVDPEDVCMLYPDGSITVTSTGVRGFVADSARESDAYDIAAFDFTEPLHSHPNLRAGFLSFDVVPPDVQSDQVIALVTAGFPSSDQIYDLGDNNHLGLVKRNVTATLGGQPEDITLIRARFVVPLDFDPDGLSGSPVFVIQLENGEPSTYLAGMMMRAGKEKERLKNLPFSA